MSDCMKDLVNEVENMMDLLAKSGFFSTEEIEEIIEEQFIYEDIDLDKFSIPLNNQKNDNFQILEETFEKLAEKSIIGVHNCGYDFKEGVEDIYELYIHLVNNGYHPEGFCFYTFEDVEESILSKKLKITFGDYNKNEKNALKIGKTVYEYLENANLRTEWDESVNTQITIMNFEWDKKYNAEKEYEIEGAYDLYCKVNKK